MERAPAAFADWCVDYGFIASHLSYNNEGSRPGVTARTVSPATSRDPKCFLAASTPPGLQWECSSPLGQAWRLGVIVWPDDSSAGSEAGARLSSRPLPLLRFHLI